MPLIDSDTWISKMINLKQLHFHPANPRLPELRGKASEREIIHELCKRGEIEDIARPIAEKGYFRNDRLIVLRENGRNIVYEGNRRLCALKVLDDPDLAPPVKQNLYRKLSEKAKLPKKIAVEIVPFKFDAEIVMYAKHTGQKFVARWDPIQQATFIAAKIGQGETISDVCRECSLSRDAVIHARASVDLYRLARLAPLTPKAQALVDDPARFPYSTVYERLFRPLESRKKLGVEIDENGMTINSTEETFLPLLAQILDDEAHGNIDTRELGTQEGQLKYVRGLNFSPGGGRFTAEDVEQKRKSDLPRPSPTASSTFQTTRAKPRSLRPDGKFLPKDLALEYPHVKLSRLIEEAQRLEVGEVPLSCAFLLRTLLETALKVKSKQLRVHGRMPARNPKLGSSLSEMLDYVNQHPHEFNLDPGAKIALESLVSRHIKQSKPQLDRIVHEPSVITTAEEMIGIREAALPLLVQLLGK